MRAYSQQQSSMQDVMLGKLLPFASLLVRITSKSNNNTMPSLTKHLYTGSKVIQTGANSFYKGNGQWLKMYIHT
jgi:hypothetical protein